MIKRLLHAMGYAGGFILIMTAAIVVMGGLIVGISKLIKYNPYLGVGAMVIGLFLVLTGIHFYSDHRKD